MINYLFSFCDKCCIYSVEAVKDLEVPVHVRHFISNHLGHELRFLIRKAPIEVKVEAYSLSIGDGFFLTKTKDKEKYLEKLRTLKEGFPDNA